ncbi:MAG: hypothetical protein ACXV8S_01610 [Methylobacter sp.]
MDIGIYKLTQADIDNAAEFTGYLINEYGNFAVGDYVVKDCDLERKSKKDFFVGKGVITGWLDDLKAELNEKQHRAWFMEGSADEGLWDEEIILLKEDIKRYESALRKMAKHQFEKKALRYWGVKALNVLPSLR